MPQQKTAETGVKVPMELERATMKESAAVASRCHAAPLGSSEEALVAHPFRGSSVMKISIGRVGKQQQRGNLRHVRYVL